MTPLILGVALTVSPTLCTDTALNIRTDGSGTVRDALRDRCTGRDGTKGGEKNDMLEYVRACRTYWIVIRVSPASDLVLLNIHAHSCLSIHATGVVHAPPRTLGVLILSLLYQ